MSTQDPGAIRMHVLYASFLCRHRPGSVKETKVQTPLECHGGVQAPSPPEPHDADELQEEASQDLSARIEARMYHNPADLRWRIPRKNQF